MERLTEWIDEDKAMPKMNMKRNGHQRCMNKLAELEDMEEQGKLLILPCKPGDTVYVIDDDCECPGDCYQSQTCKSCEYRNLHIEEYVATLKFIVENIDNFGKTVFLIDQESKEALEGMKNERN